MPPDCFSVPYAYDLTSGGDVLPLMLAVPAGVTVAALPLTPMSRNDYRITDPGSMRHSGCDHCRLYPCANTAKDAGHTDPGKLYVRRGVSFPALKHTASSGRARKRVKRERGDE